MNEKDIMVSVVCLAYNHERYIRKALESFVMQVTNFRYEIIIHDDASTDNTANIIREYEKKYPDLIHPIYQTENQYSKGVNVELIAEEHSRGKYIAYCEGDDFWTDAYKLQKQFDYMEAHPECSLCVHAAFRVNDEGKKLNYHIRPNTGNKEYTVEEVIIGGGGLFPTCSYFSRAKYSKNMPEFYINAPVGDYPFAIYMALKGKVYYMDEFMSSYRVNAIGSWTVKEFSDINKRIRHFQRIADMLDEINEYTYFKYAETIRRTKLNNQFQLLLEQEKIKEIKQGEYKKLYLRLGRRERIKINLNYYCLRLLDLLRAIKRLFSIGRGNDDR